MNFGFISVLPPIIAIALALITKEVYSSLFIGILIGGAIYAGGSFTVFFEHVLQDGMVSQLSDSWNVGILIFLVILGVMVCLMNKAGGSAAFGNWAKKHIKTKTGAQLATIALGVMIFIDDYFNCLTVGSVMKPVTDNYKISKEKLAYLIDATAAPICIIAPISSWAAAVAGFAPEGQNGIALFCSAIPYNFYALFTIGMMIILSIFSLDFGPMKKFEAAVARVTEKSEQENIAIGNGKVIDLVFPIVILIVMCVLGMIYTGGFFATGEDKAGFVDAFANSDASVGLVIGSMAALIITLIFYLPRRVLSFKECMTCIPEGFKAMVPAILILSLAWTLKAMTDSLGAADYVAGVVEGSAAGFKNFLPAIIFLIACGLAFATGTSWGTFGILIPICIAAFPEAGDPIRIISISACMAGAVCGDHCSPISDTTIMASAGAQCNHVNHVATQLPYAISVAVISFITYIFAGFIKNAFVSILFGLVILIAFLLYMRKREAAK
ncbi:MAG: Na+/H+ antiporter NhaC family protein [Spirochaetia bacterium]|nr:Na+/H+ antiporter NhaC family protein [Spirochaetia bacterium]MBP5739534.1 Na+/H+ antiporter NhaC family protein [Spirochaetia bacterium]